MNVSAPIKIFALVGLLAALVLGGGMMVMGRGQVEADAAPIVIPTKSKTPAPAKPQPVAAKPTPKAKPKPAAAKPKPAAAKPKPAPPVAPNGLPTAIATALQRHDVVVVALWGSGGKIDAISRDEAEAGAAAAGAGFVALNVISSGRAAEALTLEVGSVLRAPGVLVFARPETLAIKLDGFRDRDAVAQAALNALR